MTLCKTEGSLIAFKDFNKSKCGVLIAEVKLTGGLLYKLLTAADNTRQNTHLRDGILKCVHFLFRKRH